MAEKPVYQKDYSLLSPVLLDYEKRKPKIDKMMSVLKDAGVFDTGKCRLALDIGCSGGFFAESLASFFEKIIGIDIDSLALIKAKESNENQNVFYMTADSMFIPLQDNSVDLIICNHVYEHVPDPVRLFSEIYRVLDNEGVCYFGAASRLTLFEPHYHLPFLTWLPKWMAHYYMRLMRKGEYYYENLRTYWGIKELIKKFKVYDYTLKIVAAPDKFAARDLIPQHGLIEKIPLIVWKSLYWILPGYIFILKKCKD